MVNSGTYVPKIPKQNCLGISCVSLLRFHIKEKVWEKWEMGVVSVCLFSDNVGINQFLWTGMTLSRGNKVLLVGGWCNGLFKPICHFELRMIVPDQQWMSKCGRFASNSTDVYLINTFCSTVSSDSTSVSQLAAVFFTLRGFFVQRHERSLCFFTLWTLSLLLGS